MSDIFSSHDFVVCQSIWQRHDALVLVWRGTRQWDHLESALFTTVHSGARRISEEKRREAYHSFRREPVAYFSRFLFVMWVEWDPCTNSVRQVCAPEKNPSREMENATIRIFLQCQRENFRFFFSEPRFRNTNFKPIPGIEEQYRVSAKTNGSCFCGRLITSKRSLTSSWTIIGMCCSFRGVATSE